MRSVGIVGDGRAGRSFASALRRRGWEVTGPLRRGEGPATLAGTVDLVLVATPDAAVAGVAAAIPPDERTVVAHVAGALTLDAVASHARRASIHPLVPMPDGAAGAARLLAGAWFAVAGSGPDELALAEAVVDDLGGTAVTVADADRVRYHAAACIAANHLVALMGQVERVAASVGVPLAAFTGLAGASLANVAELGPAAALTGPVARGDAATVAAHIAALPAEEVDAYAALARAAQRLVRPEVESPPWESAGPSTGALR